MVTENATSTRNFDALGKLLLMRADGDGTDKRSEATELEYIAGLDQQQFQDLLKQAETQRVLRRTLEALKDKLPSPRLPFTEVLLSETLLQERLRVEKVLTHLRQIVDRLEARNCAVMVMKTLDHWPDTGSDLDLLVHGQESEVCDVFERELGGERQAPSWGDRLAHKFNFRIPDLPELVEVHVGCLGQTGEQNALAMGVLSRRTQQNYDRYMLPVPIPEDRIVIATLQRMYRHFYIRLTDIVNIVGLLSRNQVDFDRLQAIAEVGSVWPGVATLLTIVSQHAVRYGSQPIRLPENVTAATRFNSSSTYLDQKFVRIPIVPEAADLFFHQLAGNGRKHNLRAVMRLSLLPALATAAFVSFRITGDDKGVW